MKSMNWKVIVETVGIAAIVASLIFVGLQMRQSQEIAIAETFLSILTSEIEIYNATNEHAELWAKVSSDGELTDAEVIIFENLVASIDSTAHRSRSQLERLGHTNAANLQSADLASFLFQNPAARKVWVSMWDTRTRHRTVTHGYMSTFPSEVIAYLESLDKMEH
jgi:hypothetical protein